jgi:pyridoxamine 5'-phosphate oxidase family protein
LKIFMERGYKMFSPEEIAYLQNQPLARISTVSTELQPDVAPVGFRFDGVRFTITGFDITKTLKYKNVKAGNPKVAIVIDDLASVSPWVPRGIKIHGTAEIQEVGGRANLVITPSQHWSWGIHETAYVGGKPSSRKVKHEIA